MYMYICKVKYFWALGCQTTAFDGQKWNLQVRILYNTECQQSVTCTVQSCTCVFTNKVLIWQRAYWLSTRLVWVGKYIYRCTMCLALSQKAQPKLYSRQRRLYVLTLSQMFSYPRIQPVPTEIFRGNNTSEVLPGNRCSCSIFRLWRLVRNLLLLLDSIDSCYMYIPDKGNSVTSFNKIIIVVMWNKAKAENREMWISILGGNRKLNWQGKIEREKLYRKGGYLANCPGTYKDGVL